NVTPMKAATVNGRNARRRKRYQRKRPTLSMRMARSAISNGTKVLAEIDHRSTFMRRFRDLLRQHQQDLGGPDTLSEGQRCIIRRASLLQVQCEMIEAKFAKLNGSASRDDLDAYQRASNSLRRLIESLGLNEGRKAKDVSVYDPGAEDRELKEQLLTWAEEDDERDGVAP